MSTFTEQIPRSLATQLGEEAVAISKRGHYTTADGHEVDLAPAIAAAVQGTVAYPPAALLPATQPGPHDTQIEVVNETTLSAASRLLAQGYRPVALNFASGTHPGGGFLDGARAQEEYLARSSALYLCIRDNDMYTYHRRLNDPMFSDYMIYSPHVPVFRNDEHKLLEIPYTTSIITAAAAIANALPAHRHSEIPAAMWSRILKVLAVGLAHGHDAIVLGAWGCGAYGNDGTQIARFFQRALTENFRGAYRAASFAIVDWSSEQRFIGPFQAVFAD